MLSHEANMAQIRVLMSLARAHHAHRAPEKTSMDVSPDLRVGSSRTLVPSSQLRRLRRVTDDISACNHTNRL